MTNIYLIRHAESETVGPTKIRPLTLKGIGDSKKVTEFLIDKNIDAIYSSHYLRCIKTLEDFYISHLEVLKDFRNNVGLDERFSECKRASSVYFNRDKFLSVIKAMWNDFSYKYSDIECTYEECFMEVQKRSIIALEELIRKHFEKNIVIGTHSITMSLIINYYDHTYGFENFRTNIDKAPWAVTLSFDNLDCIKINEIDLFTGSSILRL